VKTLLLIESIKEMQRQSKIEYDKVYDIGTVDQADLADGD
jgi:hypothetical protein